MYQPTPLLSTERSTPLQWEGVGVLTSAHDVTSGFLKLTPEVYLPEEKSACFPETLPFQTKYKPNIKNSHRPVKFRSYSHYCNL